MELFRNLKVLVMVYLKNIGFLTTQQFYTNILIRAFYDQSLSLGVGFI